VQGLVAAPLGSALIHRVTHDAAHIVEQANGSRSPAQPALLYDFKAARELAAPAASQT
jgi:hypothetical protein